MDVPSNSLAFNSSLSHSTAAATSDHTAAAAAAAAGPSLNVAPTSSPFFVSTHQHQHHQQHCVDGAASPFSHPSSPTSSSVMATARSSFVGWDGTHAHSLNNTFPPTVDFANQLSWFEGSSRDAIKRDREKEHFNNNTVACGDASIGGPHVGDDADDDRTTDGIFLRRRLGGGGGGCDSLGDLKRRRQEGQHIINNTRNTNAQERNTLPSSSSASSACSSIPLFNPLTRLILKGSESDGGGASLEERLAMSLCKDGFEGHSVASSGSNRAFGVSSSASSSLPPFSFHPQQYFLPPLLLAILAGQRDLVEALLSLSIPTSPFAGTVGHTNNVSTNIASSSPFSHSPLPTPSFRTNIDEGVPMWLIRFVVADTIATLSASSASATHHHNSRVGGRRPGHVVRMLQQYLLAPHLHHDRVSPAASGGQGNTTQSYHQNVNGSTRTVFGQADEDDDDDADEGNGGARAAGIGGKLTQSRNGTRRRRNKSSEVAALVSGGVASGTAMPQDHSLLTPLRLTLILATISIQNHESGEEDSSYFVHLFHSLIDSGADFTRRGILYRYTYPPMHNFAVKCRREMQRQEKEADAQRGLHSSTTTQCAPHTSSHSSSFISPQSVAVMCLSKSVPSSFLQFLLAAGLDGAGKVGGGGGGGHHHAGGSAEEGGENDSSDEGWDASSEAEDEGAEAVTRSHTHHTTHGYHSFGFTSSLTNTTLLIIASRNGNEYAVEALLESVDGGGGVVDVGVGGGHHHHHPPTSPYTNTSLITTVDSYGRTAVHWAAALQHTASMIAMLQSVSMEGILYSTADAQKEEGEEELHPKLHQSSGYSLQQSPFNAVAHHHDQHHYHHRFNSSSQALSSSSSSPSSSLHLIRDLQGHTVLDLLAPRSGTYNAVMSDLQERRIGKVPCWM